MANEMIERVAKEAYGGDWDRADHMVQIKYRMIVKTVITAMREPTEAMLDAGAYDLDMKLTQQWQNMIDAALKE